MNFAQYKRVEWDRKRHYQIDVGKEYPSSTTILSIKDKPALPPWAAKKTAEYAAKRNKELIGELSAKPTPKQVQELENNLTSEKYVKECKGAPWRESEGAMDIGSLVHDMISEFHKEELAMREKSDEFSSRQALDWFEDKTKERKKELYQSIETLFKFADDKKLKELKKDAIIKLRNCIKSFLKWRDEVNFVIVASEFTVYSDTNKYAGTVDALGYVNGILTLVDYKTTSGIWPEHDLQVVSYLDALNEMYQRSQIKIDNIVEQIYIINFTREGKLEKKMVENHKEALDVFLGFKRAFVANQIWEAASKMSMAKSNQ